MQRVPGYPQTPAHKDAQRSLAVLRWGGSPGTCIVRGGPYGRFETRRTRSFVRRESVAFWIRAPGVGELRRATVPVVHDGEVLVRALRSGVSRGTETLVFRGEVPPAEYARMRAPFQEGDFPGPVKYGYLNVGVVEQGPPDLHGRTVFCLFPHQTAYVVPAGAVTVVPEGVPPARAVLAGVASGRGRGARGRVRRSRHRRAGPGPRRPHDRHVVGAGDQPGPVGA